MISNIAVVAMGGALGSVARYLLASALNPAAAGTAFPWGTLLVNGIGCASFGLLGGLFSHAGWISDTTRIAVLVGLLGGFTTFSAFAGEALALLNHGQLNLAGLYVLASNIICLGGAWAGYQIGVRGSGAQ